MNGDGHPYVAVSHDEGTPGPTASDVGAPLGLQNIAFPAVVAGDPDRAAFAFLGTTTGGDLRRGPELAGRLAPLRLPHL